MLPLSYITFLYVWGSVSVFWCFTKRTSEILIAIREFREPRVDTQWKNARVSDWQVRMLGCARGRNELHSSQTQGIRVSVNKSFAPLSLFYNFEYCKIVQRLQRGELTQTDDLDRRLIFSPLFCPLWSLVPLMCLCLCLFPQCPV